MVEGSDVGLKFGDTAINTSAHFLVGEQGKEHLDLIEP
jgi:hypothetical protein